MNEQRQIDTVPVDVDKKAFELRPRDKDRDLAHDKMRLKSFTTAERLNEQFLDDHRVLDCEIFNPKPKKRITAQKALKVYKHKQQEKIIHGGGYDYFERSREFEQERQRLKKQFANSAFGKDISTIEIFDIIRKKWHKEMNKEVVDLGNRNFMLPSYHTKTHFKAATSLQMQTDSSLKSPDKRLLGELSLDSHARELAKRTDKASEVKTNDEAESYHGVDLRTFTQNVLKNCGVIRQKDSKVIDTVRGTGFLRKVPLTGDPYATFYGTNSNLGLQLFGNSSRDELNDLKMGS